MGARTNIVLKYGESDEYQNNQVVLYLHWGGEGGPQLVARALTNPIFEKRRDDPNYLAACIVRQIFIDSAAELHSDCSLGIQTEVNEEEYVTTYVHLDTQHVGYGDLEMKYDTFIKLAEENGWIPEEPPTKKCEKCGGALDRYTWEAGPGGATHHKDPGNCIDIAKAMEGDPT